MRAPLLAAGGLVLSIAWLGPPLMPGSAGFVGHMAVHMAVVAIAVRMAIVTRMLARSAASVPALAQKIAAAM